MKLFTVLAIVCGAATLASAAVAGDLLIYQHDYSNPEFQKDDKVAYALRKNVDNDRFTTFGDQLQSKWGKQPNKDYYFRLTFEFLGAVTATSPTYKTAPARYALASKYAFLALNQPDMPLDVAFNVLPFTEFHDNTDYSTLTADQWAQQRTDHIKVWLSIWKRLDDAVASPPTVTQDSPEYNRVSNAASLEPVGTAKCIEAHKELLQYNSAIAEYGRLKALSEMYPNLASRFIIEQYSRQPNDAELQQYLTEYVASDKDRQTILKAVAANTAVAQH